MAKVQCQRYGSAWSTCACVPCSWRLAYAVHKVGYDFPVLGAILVSGMMESA